MIRRLFAITAAGAVGTLFGAGLFLIIGPIPFWFASVLGIAGLAGLIIRWQRPGFVLAWSFGLILFALSGVTPWPAPDLVRDAERIADGTPYCIQVAEGGDYRQAESWFDFSPANMRALIRSDRAMQFHAILAIGSGSEPAIYNWSYRSMRWKGEQRSYATPVISCVARRSFATNLPYFSRMPLKGIDAKYSHRNHDMIQFEVVDDPGVLHLRLVGRTFTIPVSYHPRAHAADNPYLRLILDIPSVTPMTCPDVRSCINHWIMIYLNPASVMRWLDGPTTKTTRLIDDRAGPNGSVRTRIDCHPASFNDGLNCVQHFLFDGVLFRFHMREADLGDWRVIQNRLVAVFLDLQPHQ